MLSCSGRTHMTRFYLRRAREDEVGWPKAQYLPPIWWARKFLDLGSLLLERRALALSSTWKKNSEQENDHLRLRPSSTGDSARETLAWGLNYLLEVRAEACWTQSNISWVRALRQIISMNTSLTKILTCLHLQLAKLRIRSVLLPFWLRCIQNIWNSVAGFWRWYQGSLRWLALYLSENWSYRGSFSKSFCISVENQNMENQGASDWLVRS